MIKEAMKYLVDLAPTQLKEICGLTYADAPLNVIAPALPAKIEVATLASIGKLANDVPESYACWLTVQPTSIILHRQPGQWNRTPVLAVANAIIPSFQCNGFQPHDQFILWVPTHFEDGIERARLLSFAGNVRTEQVATSTDDGVTQVASVKRGAKLREEGWKNPVELAPFRTFDEINQPKSKFIFRIREDMQMGLFTVEDNAWRLAAMRAIKKHLVEVLGVKKEIYL